MQELVVLRNIKKKDSQNVDLLELMIAHKEKFFLSVLLLSTSSLLSFFEFQAFRSLNFGFHLALSITLVLQAILICLEVLFSFLIKPINKKLKYD